MTAGAGPELAREAAGVLASLMADTADRALVEQLIRTHREGGRMPSMAILPPLGQVAARILAGDGTDDAAQYWLRAGEAERSYQLDGEPAIPGTLVRDGHPGDINDPERYPD
jgi:hypothetical protein